MRIAIDIDSTLHHYWDVLSRAARDRFGVDLPYDSADHLGHHAPEAAPGPGLCRGHAPRRGDPRRDALSRCGGDGPRVARGRPLHPHHEPPGRVGRGRDRDVAAARSGCPTTSCTARMDKIARCREIGIDLLVDDSPVNIARAVDAGIAVATISHPWNRDVCEDEDVICAADWAELAARAGAAPGACAPPGLSAAHSFSRTVRNEPVPASLHAHQFPRRGRYRLPSLHLSVTNELHG